MSVKRTVSEILGCPIRANPSKPGSQTYYRVRLSKPTPEERIDLVICDDDDLLFRLQQVKIFVSRNGEKKTQSVSNIGHIIVEWNEIKEGKKKEIIWNTHSRIEKGFRGKGLGVFMYYQIVKYCSRHSMKLFSSLYPSHRAVHMYYSRRWMKLGYDSFYNNEKILVLIYVMY